MLSIEFIFAMHITGFVERTLLILVNVGCIVFLQEIYKKILIHYGLWSQIRQIVPVSKRCIWLSSNLMCILLVTIGQTLLILLNVVCIYIYFAGKQKRIPYTLRPKELNSLKCLSTTKNPNSAFDWAQIYYVHYR